MEIKWTDRSRVLEYALGVSLAAGALMIRGVLPVGSGISVYPAAMAAVILSAWYGGRGPAWIATAICAVGARYFFFEPPHTLSIDSLGTAVSLASFTTVSVLMIEFSMARRRSEVALGESEQRFRLMVENVHELLWIFDVESPGILYLSPSYERIFGRPRPPSGWDPSNWVEFVHPEERERVRAEYAKFVAGAAGERFEFEYRIVRPDGEVRGVRSHSVLIRDRRNKIFRVAGIAEDITERGKAQQALAEMQAELAHVTRVTTMGELAASIAHDINQPLAAVVTNGSACLRWLAAGNLGEARQAVERIVREGTRAGEIISGIRALLRKTPSKKAAVDMNQAIAEVIALARAEAQRRRVKLDAQLSQVPEVLGDRVQLQQVLLNLVLNGIESAGAVADGPREMLVSSEADGVNGVLITVRDTGGGFEGADANRLFDAFYSTKQDGMGMGLAISRSIVESHQGRIWAARNEPRGAVFRFTVPAVRRP